MDTCQAAGVTPEWHLGPAAATSKTRPAPANCRIATSPLHLWNPHIVIQPFFSSSSSSHIAYLTQPVFHHSSLHWRSSHMELSTNCVGSLVFQRRWGGTKKGKCAQTGEVKVWRKGSFLSAVPRLRTKPPFTLFINQPEIKLHSQSQWTKRGVYYWAALAAPPFLVNYHNGRNLCNQPIFHHTHHRRKKVQMW